MAWIEVHQELPTHRKTVAAAELLHRDPITVTGHLIALWLWAIDHASDGRIYAPPALIAAGAYWTGKPGPFVRALVTAGWLDEVDGGLFLHDWAEYAGRLIGQRAAHSARTKRARDANSARTVPATVPATGTHDDAPTLPESPSGPPDPTRDSETLSESPADEPPSPSNLTEWKEIIRSAPNKPGVLISMVRTHSKEGPRPDDGVQAGTLINDVGDAEYAAWAVWESINAPQRQGSIFKYAKGIVAQRRNGHGERGRHIPADREGRDGSGWGEPL